MTINKLAAAALAFTILNGPANAAVVIDIFQSGGDVVATGSGTIDLTGLTFFESAPVGGMGAVIPSLGTVVVGPDVVADLYEGASGPRLSDRACSPSDRITQGLPSGWPEVFSHFRLWPFPTATCQEHRS